MEIVCKTLVLRHNHAPKLDRDCRKQLHTASLILLFYFKYIYIYIYLFIFLHESPLNCFDHYVAFVKSLDRNRRIKGCI
jgi:hypothetical protein